MPIRIRLVATNKTKLIVDPLNSLLPAPQDANQAIRWPECTERINDWAAYGESQKRLNDALTEDIDAQKKLDAQGGSSS